MIIENTVRKKSVSLIGSAPHVNSPGDSFQTDLLVSVNAAALGFGNALVPDITIINTAVAGSPNAGKPTRERLHELTTKHLVVVESGVPLDRAEPIFSVIKRESTENITLDARCLFLERYLGKPLTGRAGGQHVPSTGFFSLLLLLSLGASRVSMHGFSLLDGHSYLPVSYKREHVDRDREVLQFVLNRKMPVSGRIKEVPGRDDWVLV